MRVVLFTSSFLPKVGGMEYVIHYLAEALLDAGIDVTVMAKRSSQKDNFSHRYRLIRYGVSFQGGHRLHINHLSARWELARLIRKQGIDLVHIHSVSVPPLLCLEYLQSKRIPVVMTPHGEDVQRIPEIGYGVRLQPKWDRIVARHLLAADAVTAISQSIRQEIDFVEPGKIFDVPNGIHTKIFDCHPSAFLQEMLGLKRDTRIILSVGRNHIKKGYELGIRAIAELAKTHEMDGWNYVLIGKGVSALRPVVESLGLSRWVSLVEVMSPDKLRQCYNSSHIFFSPSIVEGLSLVSIEAMACGLPLVVTDVPGNEDVVRDNGCGVIVRSKDTHDMARGLAGLMGNADRRETLGKLALQRSGEYDWQVIARKYIGVYEQVLGSPGI